MIGLDIQHTENRSSLTVYIPQRSKVGVGGGMGGGGGG